MLSYAVVQLLPSPASASASTYARSDALRLRHV